jgi:N-acetylmuramic acid 6-phosphate etherase
MINLQNMTTEARNVNSENFSAMSIQDCVRLMNEEDFNAVKAVGHAQNQIVSVIELACTALKNGGRIIYMGAGTSGRLGVLDAVECPPTFGVDYETVIGLMAGGEDAFVKAREGAEDSFELGGQDLARIHLTSNDLVIGIAASGRTPYVLGGLDFAQKAGAMTGAIVCNPNSPIAKACPHTIELDCGPEVLSGSTRLKAGTATKLVLNMISTISMKSVGKIYKNWMVDVKMTNEKLVARGIKMLMDITGADEETAKNILQSAHGHVKTAIVMILHNVNESEAHKLLEEADGQIDRIQV